jgi:hypothetical protein
MLPNGGVGTQIKAHRLKANMECLALLDQA